MSAGDIHDDGCKSVSSFVSLSNKDLVAVADKLAEGGSCERDICTPAWGDQSAFNADVEGNQADGTVNGPTQFFGPEKGEINNLAEDSLVVRNVGLVVGEPDKLLDQVSNEQILAKDQALQTFSLSSEPLVDRELLHSSCPLITNKEVEVNGIPHNSLSSNSFSRDLISVQVAEVDDYSQFYNVSWDPRAYMKGGLSRRGRGRGRGRKSVRGRGRGRGSCAKSPHGFNNGKTWKLDEVDLCLEVADKVGVIFKDSGEAVRKNMGSIFGVEVVEAEKC